jgi:hypothetical protein
LSAMSSKLSNGNFGLKLLEIDVEAEVAPRTT